MVNKEQISEVSKFIIEKSCDIDGMESSLKHNMDVIQKRLIEQKNHRFKMDELMKVAQNELENEKIARVDRYKVHLKKKLNEKYEKIKHMIN